MPPPDPLSRPARSGLREIESLADVTAAVPGGFAGIVRLPHGWVLMLVEPKQSQNAINAIKDLTHPVVIGPNDVISVEKARWRLSDLLEWYAYILPRLRSVPISTAKVDQRANRIVLGVPHQRAMAAAKKRLMSLNVPCKLVKLVVQPYARVAAMDHFREVAFVNAGVSDVPFRADDASG
ncbi:MAG TPA: hypothetical protein VJ717_18095 [Gemmatimonadaceae bacterium]|nr:hypothetical protein [Gemmatimonadaceae bacterium]